MDNQPQADFPAQHDKLQLAAFVADADGDVPICVNWWRLQNVHENGRVTPQLSARSSS